MTDDATGAAPGAGDAGGIEVRVDVDVPVVMRDGTVLLADVYRPATGGPVPALVHRTAYGKRTAAMVSGLVADPAVLAGAGFAVVVQDVRGRFASAGTWVPFVHEIDDGYDTVEWAAVQPWSNGSVGCYGSSYMGITTHLAVASRPPHLEAAAVLVASRDPNDGLLRTGGAFELGFLSRWALNNAADTIARVGLDDAATAEMRARLAAAAGDPLRVIATMPVRDVELLRLVAPYWQDWIDRPPGDPVWDRTWGLPGDVTVPLLSVVGFRDWMQPSMLSLFERIQDGRHRLVAGPWTHLSAYGGPTGERDLRGEAPGGPATFGPLLRAWFERWLVGSPGPVVEQPIVRYFSTGDDRWAEAGAWPPPGEPLTLYLGAHPDPSLRIEPPRVQGRHRFRHDPADPVPTTGGMICQPDIGPDGIVDQRLVEERPDVVVLTTAPLTVPVRLAGSTLAALWWVSEGEDTDVVVKLVDVEPDGYAANVTEGVLRARYRLGGTEDWLVPGRPTLLAVRVAEAAHTFRPGHRIRVDIAASNHPRLSINLNTRTVPEKGTLDDAVPAEQQILFGGANLSRVVLHVL